MNKLLIGLVCLSLVLSFVAVTKPGQIQTIVREIVGAASNQFTNGIAYTNREDFDGNVKKIATSSVNYTIPSSDVCLNPTLEFQHSVAAATTTLPLTQGLLGDCLKARGSVVSFTLWNSTTTLTASFLVANSASSSLFASSSAGGAPYVYGGRTADVTGRHVASGTQEWIIWNIGDK